MAVIDFFRNDFLLIRKAILLLPPKSLFLEDLFERQIKFVYS